MNLAQASVCKQLSPKAQRELLTQAREVIRQAPLVRPTTPNGMPMRVRVSAAGSYGWVGDGAYRYDPVQKNGRPWPELPAQWSQIADEVAGKHAWDCAILNWYEDGSALGWHRDLAERDHTLPIVTISLGDDCVWAMRLDEDSPVHRCRLSSGDVTVLEGPTRLALHTIERIIPNPMFSPLGVTRGRVSLTLRVAG